MKELITSNGVPFWVDDADFEAVSKYKWYWMKGAISRVPSRSEKIATSRQSLHQFLLAGDGCGTREIDHKDRNPRNNTRGNLRRSDRTQQTINTRVRSDSTTGVKGVARKRKGQWMAYIDLYGVRRYLYSGKSFEAAVEARKQAEVKYHQPILERD